MWSEWQLRHFDEYDSPKHSLPRKGTVTYASSHDDVESRTTDDEGVAVMSLRETQSRYSSIRIWIEQGYCHREDWELCRRGQRRWTDAIGALEAQLR